MLRAGPLSSPRVIKYLNQHFVNVWVLIQRMRQIVRKQLNSPVRRFAAMVANAYEFPVIIGVVSPDAPTMLGRYKLNNLLNRWQGVKFRRKTWVENLAAPLLYWLYAVNPEQEPIIQGQAYTPEQSNYEYIKLLWQAAQKHPQGRKIPAP